VSYGGTGSRWLHEYQQVAGREPSFGHPQGGGDPSDVHAPTEMLDHHEYIEAAQQDGVDVGEVDDEDRLACAAKNCLQVGPERRGAGSSPALLRIIQSVDAAIEWPSPTSSPRTRP
jgi:hypothetical protein